MKFFILGLIFVQNVFSFEIEKIFISSAKSSYMIEAVKGEIIVQIPDEKRDEIMQKLKGSGYFSVEKIYKDFYLARSNSSLATSNSMNILEKNGIKAYPNRIFRPFLIPNDPDISNQYYLSKINAFSAWDFEEHKTTVTVAVVDGGVDSTHMDLTSALYSTQVVVAESIDRDYNRSFNIFNEYFPFHYSSTHGTMVSGVVGAVRNTEGISGVSTAKIYSFDAFRGSSPVGTGYLDEYGIIKTMEYIKNNLSDDYYGKVIINMSLGGQGECDPALESAISDIYNYASNSKFIIVASAGNEAGDVSAPANCAGVIPVSATDEGDNLSSFSNHGSAMLNGLSAPGSNIYTTIPGNDYSYVDGTSFSAPIVSAVMAEVWSKKPDYKNYEVIDLVKRTAKDLGDDGPDKKYGWGRVDMYKAFSYIESDLSSKGVNKDFLAWPNPFYISKDLNIKFSVKKSIIYPDDKLMIYDFNGNFIAYAKRDGESGFIWDGKNQDGVLVVPGPYVAYYKSDKGHAKTKFMLFR